MIAAAGEASSTSASPLISLLHDAPLFIPLTLSPFRVLYSITPLWIIRLFVCAVWIHTTPKVYLFLLHILLALSSLSRRADWRVAISDAGPRPPAASI